MVEFSELNPAHRRRSITGAEEGFRQLGTRRTSMCERWTEESGVWGMYGVDPPPFEASWPATPPPHYRANPPLALNTVAVDE